MINLNYISLNEIKRIRQAVSEPITRAGLLANIFRLNTLYMIMRAGSGHLGTSFSCTDIITWLWLEELGQNDIYFSSKGHDAPALYSLLLGLGKLEFSLIHKLRRLGGLPGHPDVSIPHMITNTGSLGMGIAKARGMALAKRQQGKQGRVYVLTGDGELQEGQIWESLQPTSNHQFSEITVIVDHNKIQSDLAVTATSDLGELETKFKAFGWAVWRCSGHNFQALQQALTQAKKVADRPQVIIADTIKGRGVSLMEELPAGELYRFHSGAPSSADYAAGLRELLGKINTDLKQLNLSPLKLESVKIPDRVPPPATAQRLVAAFGDELAKLAKKNKKIIAMDADLVLDTGLVTFKKQFPERYVECGIAEQDMVSLAGGLALRGQLPLVNSFACFLTPRANEQIYNNATEKTKIIYVGSLAGLLPATPGHSHQSVRDISLLGSVPGLTLIEPADEQETRLALRWAVEKNKQSTYLRLVSLPLVLDYKLPVNHKLIPGRGVYLRRGQDILIIAYGPVMLNQALKAAKLLAKKKISAAVMNLPWLNRFDEKWLSQELKRFKKVFTIDDHYTTLGQGQQLASILAKLPTHPPIHHFGLSDIPACGQPDEILKHHQLDSQSLASQILKAL